MMQAQGWASRKQMANISGAKLLAVKALGEKLAMLTVELNGKQGEIKAWKSDIEGLQPGHVFASAETEKKPPYNKPNAPQSEHEVWLKSEKKPSGKGGGVAKSDPAKNAVIVIAENVQSLDRPRDDAAPSQPTRTQEDDYDPFQD